MIWQACRVMAAFIPTLAVSAWIFMFVVLNVFDATFAVDGKFGEWSEWQPCSATCGGGTRKRFRFCNNPAPSQGGAWCAGKSTEEGSCRTADDCPMDGKWSNWSLWSECSVTCGEGSSRRVRACDSPHPSNGGRDCEGSSEEIKRCIFSPHCPRNGKWSLWSQWSACSVTCGEGSTERYRSCNNPPPSPNGKPCPGSNKQSERCIADIDCPVNGHWSEWSQWSSCSVTCGQGSRKRWRMCDNPRPQNGGLDCSKDGDSEMQDESCHGSIVFCAVNGEWSDWSEWGACTSSDCKNKKEPPLQIRHRSCNSPYPAHNGSMCQGVFLNASMCDEPVNCPVDGQWSEWSPFSCKKEYVTRRRYCDGPPPSNGGKDCVGEKAETILKEDQPSDYATVLDGHCQGRFENEDEEPRDNEEKRDEDEEKKEEKKEEEEKDVGDYDESEDYEVVEDDEY